MAPSSALAMVITLVHLFMTIVSSAPGCSRTNSCSQRSEVNNHPGHLPSSYCKITDVVFKTGDMVIKIDADLKDLDKCGDIKKIWQFEQSGAENVDPMVCDQVFSRGHFFTTYYFYGSDYFHLHYDTMIPLFVGIHQYGDEVLGNENDVALLPGVEVQRGKGIDWRTDAFDIPNVFWMQYLRMLSKPHKLLPLDQRLAGINKTVCFREAYFGTPKVDFTNPELLHSYAEFAKKSFGIDTQEKINVVTPKIGVIYRYGARNIVHEEYLKKVSTNADVEIVKFNGRAVKDQIEAVQKYQILIGINGPELMNALYLPKESVVVQIVPQKPQVNVRELSKLLRTRGPYLEWHNSRSEPDHNSNDLQHNEVDTVMDIGEFAWVVDQALEIYHKKLNL